MKNIKRIRKTEVINTLAEKMRTSKAQAKRTFNEVFDVILEKLGTEAKSVKSVNDVVTLSTPLWLVKVVMTKERMGVNPQEPTKKIKIPAKKKIKVNKTLA